MSHKTTIETQLTDSSIIESVMKELGFSKITGQVFGQKCEIAFSKGGYYDAVGFNKVNGTYTMVGDSMLGATLQQIIQLYGVSAIEARCRKIGKQFTKTKLTDGTIRIKVVNC